MRTRAIAFLDPDAFYLGSMRLSRARVGAAFLDALDLALAGHPITSGPFTGLYVKHRSVGVSAEQRARIIARDGLVCRYCGDEDGPFEIDHIHPVAKGGGDEDENLCVACANCNRRKGARLDFV